ncbi:MAG: GtrA family protein [Alphaproteobacteria bacterium]|nr:GtrA family protein [Alphaproteobacteria bacterium]
MKRLFRSQFVRFAFVGTLGFATDSAVLFVFHRLLGFDPYSARAISIFVAMNVTWYGNRYVTFRDRRARRPGAIVSEWARFLLTNALGAVINYGVYAAIVRFAPPPFDSPYVGLVAGVAAGLSFNFFFSKRLVFLGAPG